MALLTGEVASVKELEELAHLALVWATGKDVPWFFIVTEENLPAGADAAAGLADCGLVPALRLTGMYAADVAPLSSEPGELELTVPADDPSAAAMVAVNSAAYQMDLQPAAEYLGSQRFWRRHFAVLGKVGSTPVTSSAVLIVDGHRYVAWVATHPLHQRRGYAEAAMRHSLDLAGEAVGRIPTTLHATDAGFPVYLRMGYAPIARHTLFIESRFLTGH
ncbi:MAG: hypothetical protein Kow001_20480 [Acidobacteriota bacterium]